MTDGGGCSPRNRAQDAVWGASRMELKNDAGIELSPIPAAGAQAGLAEDVGRLVRRRSRLNF